MPIYIVIFVWVFNVLGKCPWVCMSQGCQCHIFNSLAPMTLYGVIELGQHELMYQVCSLTSSSRLLHYDDVTMNAMASQITSLTIVYSTVYSDPDQRKHQSFASLAFVQGIHRGPVNTPHKWPVTRKMSSFDDVIMGPVMFSLPYHWIHITMAGGFPFTQKGR